MDLEEQLFWIAWAGAFAVLPWALACVIEWLEDKTSRESTWPKKRRR